MPKPNMYVEVYGFKGMEKMYADTKPATQETMLRVLRSLGVDLAQAIRGATPVGATRRLKASTRFAVQVKTVGGRLHGILEVGQPAVNAWSGYRYQPAVRFGRPPGRMPPTQQLRSWALIKLGIRPEELKRRVFAIARSIGQKGTRPNPYLEVALRGQRGRIQAASRQLGSELIVEINGRVETLQRGEGVTYLY